MKNEKIFCDHIRKKFGRHRFFGSAIFGDSSFGDDDVFFVNSKQESFIFTGIYQTRRNNGKQFSALLNYYVPKNPRTVLQQANRQKYANGILAWQAFTNNDKKIYNKKACKNKMSGYNLFLKTYLLSN
jgi:hypothetical protein